MNICEHCGEVNMSPYKKTGRYNVCRKCLKKLHHGQCRPAVGHKEVDLDVGGYIISPLYVEYDGDV